MIIDVHAHLDHPLFSGRLAEIITRAKEAGVVAIISNGIDPESNRKTLAIAKEYPLVKAALGIYPPDALLREKEIPAFDIDEELAFIKRRSKRLAAIGEIGLDYKDGGDIQLQKQVFSSQIEIAMQSKIPIIVHTRKAEDDALDLLESYSYKKTILHCFSGKKTAVQRGIDLGFSFSIPTHAVRSQQMQDLIRATPIRQLFTETDSPYLSPFPGKENEPAFVIESLKKIAELKGLDIDETKRLIYLNYQEMFS